MIKRYLVGCICMFQFIACTAQNNDENQVEDVGYQMILNTILSHSVPEINVDNLKGSFDNYVLLDAREEEEFKVSRLKGAKNVGYDYFSEDSLVTIDKSQPIVVYCSVGYRSEKITKKLQEMGYKEVYNLYGGIFEWVNQGNEVVTGIEGEPTHQVHAYDKIWGSWLKKGEKVY